MKTGKKSMFIQMIGVMGLLLPGVVFSQQATITGTVYDSSAKQALSEASVSVLNAADSFLVSSTRTDKTGSFQIDPVDRGNYLLLITYPKYVQLIETFSIDDASMPFHFGVIGLQIKSQLLEEVIVQAKRSAVRFRGDTTEYTADSFRVAPNANVEDLIKKLPGLQVDRSGNIRANGQSVTKVLVDGEEFFSDDPTLVTRNLKARMVDKVQVYDREIDKIIEDGQKSKTVNVILKESAKHGYFGKVEVGAGTDKFNQGQATFNSFKNKRKFAGYLLANNTGVSEVNQNVQEFAVGEANLTENNLTKWRGVYEGVGIPSRISAGMQYNNKWNNDKREVNTNYKLSDLLLRTEENTTTQIYLPGSMLYSQSNQAANNKIFRQAVNGDVGAQLSAASTLKITLHGALVDKKVEEQVLSQSQRENLSPLNSSNRKTNAKDDTRAFKADVLWQYKFKKPRRGIAANIIAATLRNHATGFFNTTNIFFGEQGVQDSARNIDQYKTSVNNSSTYGSKVIYTEPVSEYGSISINTGVYFQRAKSDLFTFDNSQGNVSKIPDSSFSSIYQFDQRIKRGGAMYLYTGKKFRVEAGSDIAGNQYTQENGFDRSNIRRSFVNWYPVALLAYQFTTTKNIEIQYNGNTVQPTIYQIQPVANNNDPLNIFVGNSALKPVFSNMVSGSYNSYRTQNSAYLGVGASFTTTEDPIAPTVTTDNASGQTIYSYANLNGQRSQFYTSHLFYSGRIKFWAMDLGVNADANSYHFAGLTNGATNITTNSSFELRVLLSKQKENAYFVGVGFGPSYYVNKSSLQKDAVNNFWGYQINPSISIKFSKGLTFNTDGTYTWQQPTEAFPDPFRRFVWNSSLEKSMLKNKNLVLKLLGNDILNQNKGIDRSVSSNMIFQKRYVTIARYLMLSLIWDFNKSNKPINE